MNRTLVAWLILFLSSSAAYALQVGDSENDVVAALGKPNVARKMSDGAFLWRFRDGTTVRLENGVVRELDGPGAAKSAGQQSPGAPVASGSRSAQTRAVETVTGPGAEKQKRGTNAPSSSTVGASALAATLPAGVEGKLSASAEEIKQRKLHPRGTQYFGVALLGLGILVGAACNIMFAVVAFRESVWWLLGCLFVPFVSLIFCITHWDDTKKIIGWNLLVAVPLIVGGMFMVM